MKIRLIQIATLLIIAISTFAPVQSQTNYNQPRAFSFTRITRRTFPQYYGREVYQQLMSEGFYPIGWSRDGKFAYYADTVSGVIRKVAIDPQTGLPNGSWQVFVDKGVIAGDPDGAVVDSEGFLWSARYGGGGVARVDAKGRVERFLRLPVTQVSSVMFGGADLRTLFVTTSRQRMSEEALGREPLAGALFAVDAGVRGLREPRYAL